MKAGDLVVVKGTSTGDSPWVVDLYRTQKPVLVLEIDGWVKIVDDRKKKYLSKRKVKVVS
jgi:hypothetical protein